METPRKKLEILGYIFVFSMAIFGQYYARTDLKFYEGAFTREDSFIEWMTVVGFLLGIFVCIYRSVILTPFRSTKFKIGLILWALLLFFGMAEEISWGQRVFGFKSPQWFLEHNTQGEFNFHNLRFGDFKVNRVIFGTFLGIIVVFYFLILPFLYRRIEKIKKFVNEWAIPVPRIYHIVAYVTLAAIAKTIPSGKKGEILEFGGVWIFTLMIFEPFNRDFFSRKLKPTDKVPPSQS